MSPTHRVADPIFFASPGEFREWLEQHHSTQELLWVGFHKRGTGRPSLTWPESVDEALCFGWIDGVRKRIDDERYVIRFTPRKSTSNWSRINIARMAELQAAGLVRPAGRAAFEKRTEARSGIYRYEQQERPDFSPELPTALAKRFRSEKKAWQFFQSRTRSYRRVATWWVISAQREETRERRLATLVACCAAGRPIPGLDRAPEQRAASKDTPRAGRGKSPAKRPTAKSRAKPRSK